jgi:hypothetical protein
MCIIYCDRYSIGPYVLPLWKSLKNTKFCLLGSDPSPSCNLEMPKIHVNLSKSILKFGVLGICSSADVFLLQCRDAENTYIVKCAKMLILKFGCYRDAEDW